jgi:hypothetical protein
MVDRELAFVFLANGEGFLPSAAAVEHVDAGGTCYSIAIAAELVLKAFLVTKGWSDERCRRDIRHDLEKALGFAMTAGLDAPSELTGVLAVLNAYYPKRAFDRFVVPAGDEAFPARARAVVAGLIESVRSQAEASGGRYNSKGLPSAR